MAKKRETRLQQRMRKKLEKAFPHSWWVKIHGGPYQKAGIGDLLGCVPVPGRKYGLFVNIEVKTPDDKKGASELQLENIEDIEKAGGLAFVCDDIKEAVDRVLAAVEATAAESCGIRCKVSKRRLVVPAEARQDVHRVRGRRKTSA